jgi:energy-coupling factor transporter ATP-binding protein EcfA2
MNEYETFDVPTGYNLRPMLAKKFDIKKPVIVFTAGSTGSGKSTLLNKIIKLLYKTETPIFESFLIDNYVENSNAYKQKVDKIIEDFKCNEEKSDTCDLENPSKQLLDVFSESYINVRTDGPCFDPPEEAKGCKHFYWHDWQEAIKQNKNILIETTGRGIPLGYLKDLLKITSLNDYNVVFCYSIVSFDEVIKRNKSRARHQMNTYIQDKSKSAPRLPDISEVAFKESTRNMIDTLNTLRNICLRIGRPPKSVCGEINSGGNFVLLIFDNNNLRSKLIYDSRTSDYYLTDVEFKKLLHPYGLSGGRRKSLHKKKNKKSRKNISKKKHH